MTHDSACKATRAKISDLVYDLLEGEERQAAADHIQACPACRRVHEKAVRERELLAHWHPPAAPPGLADAAIEAAHRTKGGDAESDLPWLGGRRFWKALGAVAAVLVLGFAVQWYRVSTLHADPQETFLYGQTELTPGLGGAWRVYVRNGETAQPVPDAEVHALLVSSTGSTVWEGQAVTDARGIATVTPDVPDDAAEGDYTLKVDTESNVGESAVSQQVTVRRSFRVMVSTDKPLYQPGQTIHIRTLALATADHRPTSGRKIVIEVKDPKGNKVFKKPTTTSSFGIASADFELADQVNQGAYTVVATMGDTTSERQVQVERYVLPKFKIDLATEKAYYPPGAAVSGDLTARYTFGKPVAGAKVRVVASEFIEKFRPFATAEGETDAEGNFHFDLKLKDHFVGQARKKGDAFVTLEATVVDTADHKQTRTRDLTITTDSIHIEVFPESGTLVQGVENILYVVTAYPDGRPAKTTLTMGKTSKRIDTSALGIAKVRITPQKPELQLTLTAEDAQGARATAVRRLRIGDRSETILLRTDKAVYRGGGTAHLTVLSADKASTVFVDVIKDRRAVLMKSVAMKDGRGELALDLPPDLFGTLEVHAYRIQTSGDLIADTRLIQVARADALTIKATLDKDVYRPAEKALLKFLVTRKDGEPATAALSLAGVDEAVFALQEMRPGLERVYFALQEEILKPRYEIHAHAPIAPAQAIDPPERPDPEVEEATVVLFSAGEGKGVPQPEVSEMFATRAMRAEGQQARGREQLTAATVYAPLVLLAFLLVPVLGACIQRPEHIQVRRSDANREEPEVLREAMHNVLQSWVLGIVVIPLGLFGGMLDGNETVATYAAVLGAGAALLMLVGSLVQVSNTQAAATNSILSRQLSPLPVAYVVAMGAIAYVILMRGSYEVERSTTTVVIILTVLLLIAAGISLGKLRKNITYRRRRRRSALGQIFLPVVVVCLFLALIATVTLPALMLASSAALRSVPADRAMMPLEVSMYDEATEATHEGVSGTPTLPRVRRHFPETLLWRPELITDERGRAQLEVPLADSITTWRLAASAVSRRGELGAMTTGIRVFQDFFVDVDFPTALTQHDVVSVPVAVYNYLDEPQDVRLDVKQADWFALKDSSSKTVRVGPRQVTSVHFQLEARTPGRHALLVSARGTRLADAVERIVRVVPDGRPVVQTVNGRLDENCTQEIVIPSNAIDGASDLVVKIYPGAFSQVVEGMDSIFRMPHGCFEQTSSTTYPNVLVLDYLRRTKQSKPAIEMKALNFINLGCQRLLSYEVKGGGFEWFGKSPAHTVLTAYGLMEFSDMARVHSVDPAVIRRTRRWLLAQQRNDGTWAPAQLHHASSHGRANAGLRTTAYIAWAIAQSGDTGGLLGPTFDYIVRSATRTQDTYILALCANALLAADRTEAQAVLKRLDSLVQREDKLAWWTSAGQGATFSRGNTLDIETTALAASAYLKAGYQTSTAQKALAWLIEQKDSRGTWRSTQATVHAMRALLAGAGATGSVEETLHVAVTANGALAKDLTITPETSDVYRLISLRPMVKEGANRITLETAGAGDLAYQIVATHYVPWAGPPPQAQKPIAIDVQYDTTTLKTHDLLTCRVAVRYNRPGAANMTLVDLGIPPGFEVLAGDFEALKAKGVIERYSLTGRQATLYFRTIESGRPVEFTWRLRAKFPVKVKTPRSTVYQYYEPDVRDETQPVELHVL